MIICYRVVRFPNCSFMRCRWLMDWLTDILWMLSTCALSTGVLKNPLQPSSGIVEALFWELESKRGEVVWEGGGRKGNESRERRMKLLEALGSAVVKGSEWERRPCSQPHGPFSLGIMEAFSVVLNPLVACWERAAVRPPLTTDTLRHTHPLDNWILHPEKSPPFLGWGSPLHVALTGNSPRI